MEFSHFKKNGFLKDEYTNYDHKAGIVKMGLHINHGYQISNHTYLWEFYAILMFTQTAVMYYIDLIKDYWQGTSIKILLQLCLHS